ncbi:MAG TPA: hypothetical protein VF970_07285 [Gemmatimonadales bacterium]
MKVTLAVLADAANISREGKLNILGAFNQLVAREVPVRWPLMHLVVRIEATAGEDEKHRLGIRVLDEDGKLVAPPIDAMMSFGPTRRGRPRRTQLIVGIAGAAFPRYGTYEFEVLVDSQSLAMVPLHVEPHPDKPPAAPA